MLMFSDPNEKNLYVQGVWETSSGVLEYWSIGVLVMKKAVCSLVLFQYSNTPPLHYSYSWA